jgi:tetratricopeptide (TPR) repeat protein
MGREDWYRNTTWNDEVAEAFEQKLSRARSGRPQYLRIQAVCLLESTAEGDHEVAVELLHRLIREYSDGDEFAAMEVAGAHAHLAEYFASIGRGEAAAAHIERALELEENGFFSYGCELSLAELIIAQRWRSRFEEVDTLLDSVDALLPSDHFRIATVRARLAMQQGDSAGAVAWARAALNIYEAQSSPFPRHPGVGVPKADAATLAEISRLAGATVDVGIRRTGILRRRRRR